MKIVIAGSGAVGFHLADLLSKENQDIVLIDIDSELLEYAQKQLDVQTIHGNCSSIKTLQTANVGKAELYIAATTSETTNLLSAIIAKKHGAKVTVARVNNPEYISKEQKAHFCALGIDKLISPDVLAARELRRLIQQTAFTDLFEFENGRIDVAGIIIGETSPFADKTLAEISAKITSFDFTIVAILRNGKTIIPNGENLVLSGDHVYISVKRDALKDLSIALGENQKPIKSIMISGDTDLALRAAELLENKYALRMVVKSRSRAKYFASVLNSTLVLEGNTSNIDLLKMEGLEQMDSFLALTNSSETNIISSTVAKEIGVRKAIALVENNIYTHLSQNFGVDTIVNTKLIAANNIFRYVRKGRVEAVASLHGVNAEIIEFNLSEKNKVINKPISALNLPDQSLISGVVRREKSYIPDGSFVLKAHDKVIIFTLPAAIATIENIFGGS